MSGFAQAYKLTRGHRHLVHIIPDRGNARSRSLCGYRPRSVWDVVIGMRGTFTAEPCETCEATYERVLRRTDGGTA